MDGENDGASVCGVGLIVGINDGEFVGCTVGNESVNDGPV